MNLMFTKIFRFFWLLFFLLLIYLDRDNMWNKIFLISYIMILTFITIFRILDSRNEWREIINEKDNFED